MNALQNVIDQARAVASSSDHTRIQALRCALQMFDAEMWQVFDPGRRELRGPGGAVVLTPMQSRVMARLMRCVGQNVSQNTFLDDMYGDAEDGGPDTGFAVLKGIIMKLRRKITAVGAPVRIFTVFGDGYRAEAVQ